MNYLVYGPNTDVVFLITIVYHLLHYLTSGTAGAAISLFIAAAWTSDSEPGSPATLSKTRIHHCGGSMGLCPPCVDG